MLVAASLVSTASFANEVNKSINVKKVETIVVSDDTVQTNYDYSLFRFFYIAPQRPDTVGVKQEKPATTTSSAGK